MKLEITRYSIGRDGLLAEDPTGTLVQYADLDPKVTALEAEVVAATTERDRCRQGIRQAQADLAHVLPSDMDREKSALAQELDRLKLRISQLTA